MTVKTYVDTNHERRIKSIQGKHETIHDWLKYFFHKYADRVYPDRYKQYTTKENWEKIPEYLRNDIGGIPHSSSLYLLMLLEHKLLPNVSGSEKEIFTNILKAFKKCFSNKTVFYLPGRNGQIPSFARNMGATIGMCTDERYIKGALSVLETGKLGKNIDSLTNTVRLSFLANCRIDNVLSILAHYRKDLQKTSRFGKTNSEMVFVNKDKLEPDIVISTNMFNTERFRGQKNAHKTEISNETLFFRLLATGVVNRTAFYCIPATECDPVFQKSEIEKLVDGIAKLNFYNKIMFRGDSIMPSTADFAFSVRLTKPIPKNLLELN